MSYDTNDIWHIMFIILAIVQPAQAKSGHHPTQVKPFPDHHLDHHLLVMDAHLLPSIRGPVTPHPLSPPQAPFRRSPASSAPARFPAPNPKAGSAGSTPRSRLWSTIFNTVSDPIYF